MAEFSVDKGDMVYLESLENGDDLDALVEGVALIHDAESGDVLKIMLILSPEDAA